MPTVFAHEFLPLRVTRHTRTHRNRASHLSRAGFGCGILLSLLVALLFISLTIVYAAVAYNLPSPDLLVRLLEPPEGVLLQPTRLYDRTGEHVLVTLQNPAAIDRQYLPLKSFSSSFINATLARIDPTFMYNPGFSWNGFRQNSHPTIAQRLVSDLLLWDEPVSVRRTLRELLLAAQVTARFGRDKVLEWYLNNAYYGHLVYGADAAARTYFGKSATDITVAEAALLAVVADAPALNPFDAPQIALEHQNKLLQELFSQGLLTVDDYRQAVQETPAIREKLEISDIAPSFTQLVLESLGKYLNIERVRRGGLQIVTTLDNDLQLQAICATTTQLTRLEGIRPTGIPNTESDCPAARLLPTIPGAGTPESQKLTANVIVLDPTSGQVLALVGAPSDGQATGRLPGHPPGSMLTPFIYLTGFTRGLSPSSLIWDIPSGLSHSNDLSEKIDAAGILNWDGRFHGPLRLRNALANDYLVPAGKVLTQMGADNTWRITRQMGLSTLQTNDNQNAERLFFEGGEVTILEISQAYGVFANNGLWVGEPVDHSSTPALEPATVLKVIEDSRIGNSGRIGNSKGNVWLDCTIYSTECPLTARPVISTQLAYLMTDVLSDEPARWPSLGHPNPLEIGRPAGAKIGRTLDGKDTWTVGYTPRLVVGVWLGSQEIGTINNVSPTGSAGLWHAIIQYANRNQPVEGWTAPPGISSLEVCDPSGMLPSPECPVVVREEFLTGSEPTYPDTLFRSFQINRETGLLATVYTPPQWIEKRVYLMVPPEAKAWAKTAGVSTPPESYDVLFTPPTSTIDAEISNPAMFASVRGTVKIIGRAIGNRFDYYRLQIGEGLNPLSWVQIGVDIHIPMMNGDLASWDTTGLSGLYAVQLLVVDQDKHVETVTIQLSVDNQSPEVTIRFPTEGQPFEYLTNRYISFQVDARDDMNLAYVEYYIDGYLLTSLKNPPFVYPWKSTIGYHHLLVRVLDAAGNVSEATVTFDVK